MSAINRLVLDLSHWNTVTDFADVRAAGVRGIIHKATEGDYNTDPTYDERRAAALDAGLLWGAYHFGTSDEVERQVDRFLSVAFFENSPDLLALDFEDYGDKSMSLDEARQFIESVEAATYRPQGVVMYSGNRIKDLLGMTVDPFFGARRLWLAHYAEAPTCQASWSTYWLWQYTDGTLGPEPHDCAGIKGGVDGDHFAGTVDELTAQWSGREPVPAPEAQVVEVTVSVRVPPGIAVNVNVE